MIRAFELPRVSDETCTFPLVPRSPSCPDLQTLHWFLFIHNLIAFAVILADQNELVNEITNKPIEFLWLRTTLLLYSNIYLVFLLSPEIRQPSRSNPWGLLNSMLFFPIQKSRGIYIPFPSVPVYPQFLSPLCSQKDLVSHYESLIAIAMLPNKGKLLWKK